MTTDHWKEFALTFFTLTMGGAFGVIGGWKAVGIAGALMVLCMAVVTFRAR